MKTKTKFAIAIGTVFLAAIFGIAIKYNSVTLPKNLYPETLIIIEAHHEEDFSGYFVAERYFDFKTRSETENPYLYQFLYVIDEDPEDLNVGDAISCIMDTVDTVGIADDLVVEYQFAF